MKKLFSFLCVLTIAMILCYGLVFAQSFPTDKGSRIISSNLSYSSSIGNSSIIQCNACFHHFFQRGFALGIKGLYTKESQGSGDISIQGIGPSVLIFFGEQSSSTIKGRMYPYIGASYLATKYEISYMAYDYYGYYSSLYHNEIAGNILSYGGGICYMLSNTVGFIIEVFLNETRLQQINTNVSKTTNVNAGIIAFLY